MDNVLVGIIVAGALILSVRHLVRIFRGKGGCNCGHTCACDDQGKTCCQDNGLIRKQP